MHPQKNESSCARRQRGFSAMELLMVIATLAILAALQYPAYRESVLKTRRAEGRAALMQLMQQQERYFSQHSTYRVFSQTFPDGFKWYSGDAPKSSAYELSAVPCKGETLQQCVMLVAEPGTANVNGHFKDEACRSLTFTSNGVQGATGAAGSCW
jgi:type IV pilus assembly protein PilE